MIKTPYIDIAISLPVMQLYTYAVPEKFRRRCRPGIRVLVPFGRRRVTGYVISGQKECQGFEAKNILDVLDDDPLFPESEIAFFKWISDYYIHPPGEVIKTALPSGLYSQDVNHVHVTEKGAVLYRDKNLSKEEHEIIDFILKKKKTAVSLKHIKNVMENPSINVVLRKMEKADIIMVSQVLKTDGIKVKKEKVILFEKNPPEDTKISEKRKKLLEITAAKKEITLSNLKKEIPSAARLIPPLEEAGFIKTEFRQVYRDPLGETVEPDSPMDLTKDQAEVVDRVLENKDSGFKTYLLNGVTGSGKTEVYLQIVENVIRQGRKAIMLVPEISLISQTERRFRARFGRKIAVIHSSLTRGELFDQWRKISLGMVDVVIGARSAIFAPLDNIGILIVDEEHDGSYKQETGLRYNARDLAVVRGKLSGCPVILGSATPSVQSMHNAVSGRFEELTLKKRINEYPLPEIELVDLKKYRDVKGYDRMIAPELAVAIRGCLEKGHQALIFLNRRGFSTWVICSECGKTMTCKYCDVTMTFHKRTGRYQCHLCGYGTAYGSKCPDCGSSDIKTLGFGTEKVESQLKTMFPDARIARMDQDSTAKKGSMVKILKSIKNRNVDIVVGTQMLAKGHDFPFITLVGIVCADISLNLPDFRAGERTFQLLAQVAGRAGRGKAEGRVIMQTYNPDHFIIQSAKDQDMIQFFQSEVPFRRALGYPPFTRMVQLKIAGADPGKVEQFSVKAAEILNQRIQGNKDFKGRCQVLGPIEAAIQKISSQFRWQILLKSSSAKLLNRLVRSMLEHDDIKSKKNIRLNVDVDPYSLM